MFASRDVSLAAPSEFLDCMLYFVAMKPEQDQFGRGWANVLKK